MSFSSISGSETAKYKDFHKFLINLKACIKN